MCKWQERSIRIALNEPGEQYAMQGGYHMTKIYRDEQTQMKAFGTSISGTLNGKCGHELCDARSNLV